MESLASNLPPEGVAQLVQVRFRRVVEGFAYLSV